MYREIVEQGVPDRFADLLGQLDRQGGTEKEPQSK
ncbi:MAG: NepR family anti-sigma factor [Propylenella sp.]